MTGRIQSIIKHIVRGRFGAALISAGVPLPLVQYLNRISGTGSIARRVVRVLRYLAGRMLVRVQQKAKFAPTASARRPSRETLQHSINPYPQTRAVHQFHSGSAVGDAVTNSLFLIQRILREHGYESEIFVEHRDPRLADRLLLVNDLPCHDDYILIVHHSMGHGALDLVLSRAARKILMYHNITPPEFLDDIPWFIPYAELGRQQLVQMRPHMMASLADSEFNLLELLRHGYESPAVSSLLFDLDALEPRGAALTRPKAGESEAEPFTILFVGRVTKSKGQADLVDAFAAFAQQYNRPSRLVIVGRYVSLDDAYPAEIRRRAAHHGLSERVILTGGVSDEELHHWLATAHAYVSLSFHEGFGVPLIEAMAYRIPVIAWPCSAIAYTIGDAAITLTERSPNAVAEALMRIAMDSAFRNHIVSRQCAFIRRYDLSRHLPALLRALAAAGGRLPLDPETRRLVLQNLRTTFIGHIKGAYSLAAVNRSMAITMETYRPGRQRVVPWENGPSADFSGVSSAEQQSLAILASRPEFPTEPQIVISQHYPIHVPDLPGYKLAMVFWEESLLPPAIVQTLNDDFDAILAPTSFVKKVLIDSGVWRPVLNVGYAPDLSVYRGLESNRPAAPGDRHFTFLHVSSCFPRKGADILLAAYARAFRKNDPVRLVIKTFPNPHNDIAAQVAQQRNSDPEMGEVTIIERDFDDNEMLTLFAQADVMVLPTRGEGFNLPAAEAMAAGMPLIVTGYGGQTDFANANNCRLLKYRFARSESHVADQSSLWIEPDQDDLVAALHEIYRDHLHGAGTSKLKSQRAVDDIERALAQKTWVERVTEGAVDVMSQPISPFRIGWVSTWDVKCGVAEYSRFLLNGFPDRAANDSVSFTIFSDDRTELGENPAGQHIVPTWTTTDSDLVNRLARSVSIHDPHVLVIQHQPGLIRWPDLSKLLHDSRIAMRTTVVVLHSVPGLASLPDVEMAAVIDALRGVARVLVHQIADLNHLKDLGLIDNVTYFPHGAPARFNAPEARALSLGSAPVIGCYGFFLPGKGIPKLIRALAHLRKTWPKIRLRLVNAQYDAGISAEEIDRCKTLATTLGVLDLIDWHTDFQTDDRSLAQLAGCDLLVLPYDESKESASGAVRIALASGVPVAVTPAAIFAELGPAVATFEGFDQSAIDRGIAQLLRDEHTRRAIQKEAESWLQEHDWKGLAVRMCGMLRGLYVSRSRR